MRNWIPERITSVPCAKHENSSALKVVSELRSLMPKAVHSSPLRYVLAFKLCVRTASSQGDWKVGEDGPRGGYFVEAHPRAPLPSLLYPKPNLRVWLWKATERLLGLQDQTPILLTSPEMTSSTKYCLYSFSWVLVKNVFSSSFPRKSAYRKLL